MRPLIIAAGLITATGCAETTPRPVSVEEARAVFATHDCCGRAQDSVIVKAGDARFDNRIISVFLLDYTNPISQHGTQHLAIVEGDDFLGAYAGTGTPVISFTDHLIALSCPDVATDCDSDFESTLDLRMNPLPEILLIDGEPRILADSI